MDRLTISFILLTILTSSQALYDSKSPVVKLTSENFNDLVINSDDLWFVEFYGTFPL